MAKRSPETVFTPRAARVNASMYVNRPKFEERLNDLFVGSKYIVIHGESGNGKTWLYKRVFSDAGIHFEVVNLGQVASAGSMSEAFRQKLGEMGHADKTGEDSNTVFGARPFNTGVEQQTKSAYSYPVPNTFSSLVKQVRKRADGDARAALVLDNFESIIEDEAALAQLAAVVLTADDESVAEHNVQVVLVGVPGNLKEAISKLPNAAPVSNRLAELPEVARLTESEARDLMHRGFKDELELSIEAGFEEELYAEVMWSTDRIAQHIHEVCLAIAQHAVRNDDVISKDVVAAAMAAWIQDSLSADLAVIEPSMNARETKVGRKNQVLFAMGACRDEDFKYSDIELIVRENFEVKDATLNVSAILSGFAKLKNPIIRRTPKQDAWRFVSPKLKMAIRTKLYRTDDGRVALRK